MAKILNIETSTGVCSVAYGNNGKVIAKKELYETNSHASNLTVLIEQLFESDNTPTLKEIDAVAISSGPGSYTGLRIGVSSAKGICYALNKPLIAIDSMRILTYPLVNTLNKEWNNSSLPVLFCPLMDARRMEVYTAVFDSQLNFKEAVSAKIVDENTFISLLKANKVIFFGNGLEKCKTTLCHKNAVFIDNCHPVAANLVSMAENAYQHGTFEDTAYFEPFYLKDFVATTPKKKIL